MTMTAILKLPFTQSGSNQYILPDTQEIAIGRDLSCNIVLDSQQYPLVSRRHINIKPIPNEQWQIEDLQSANGTFINGVQLQGSQILNNGDRISLGKNGAEFMFELLQINPAHTQAIYPPTSAPNLSNNPPNPPVSPHNTPTNNLTLSQLFPIVSTGNQLINKAFLIPGIFTVTFVVLMFATIGNQSQFNLVLASYLATAAYYFVYRLCGKYKQWWIPIFSALMTIFILTSPLLNLFIFIFRKILPGSFPSTENISFAQLFIAMFFGAGLMEELIKALPIFLFLILGKITSKTQTIGVIEPLDGILIGTASAVGFTLLETLGQYVPNITQTAGQLVGLQLLIPRVLGSVAGHIAYSGYFGYFIGLSVLKPAHKWQILIIGYLTASLLHALWNSTTVFGIFAPMIIGVLSYTFLTAAILKARAISPTRNNNFATRLNSF
jgi:RsiW-degrading membrane proteinase PrsW (M82 family)